MDQSQNTNNSEEATSPMSMDEKGKMEELLHEENQYPKVVHASALWRRMFFCTRREMFIIQEESW